MTIRRIEGGILGNMTDMDMSMTPFAAGLGAFVDMDKGDFVGRDALINADRGCRLFGLTCAAAIPGRGSVVMDAGRPVGKLTAGADSPTLGCGIGYVAFDQPGDGRGNWPGRKLRVRLPDGDEHDCEIVTLPFFDPGKNIVKGLDRTIPEVPA